VTFTCAVASGREGRVVVSWVRSGWECFQYLTSLGACFARRAERMALCRMCRSREDYLIRVRCRCVMCADT
jgi:hypothetical protein